jgi:hypothetical protein
MHVDVRPGGERRQQRSVDGPQFEDEDVAGLARLADDADVEEG